MWKLEDKAEVTSALNEPKECPAADYQKEIKGLPAIVYHRRPDANRIADCNLYKVSLTRALLENLGYTVSYFISMALRGRLPE
jgi:hypothetical protein